MNEARPIDFVVAGGPELGFGHLMRTGALAHEAIQRGWSVRFFVDGDRAARDKLREAAPGSQIEASGEWTPTRGSALVVVDTPLDKRVTLDRAQREAIPSVVIDDDRHRQNASLTLCPALHASPFESPDYCAGPRFSILSKAHRRAEPPALAERHGILLSMGGSDPHQATPRLARMLEDLRADWPEPNPFRDWHVVLGPGFLDPDGAIARELARHRWLVHQHLAIPEMVEVMGMSRIAIVGFGTSLTELAHLGTPHLSVTHHPEDLAHAQALERAGIGRSLGYAPSLHPENTTAHIRAALRDEEWQRESASRAREAVDHGQGVERVLGLFESLVTPHAVGGE